MQKDDYRNDDRYIIEEEFFCESKDPKGPYRAVDILIGWPRSAANFLVTHKRAKPHRLGLSSAKSSHTKDAPPSFYTDVEAAQLELVRVVCCDDDNDDDLHTAIVC